MNGILAGAGVVVAIMAFAFMQLVGKYEGIFLVRKKNSVLYKIIA